jgi:cytochrome c
MRVFFVLIIIALFSCSAKSTNTENPAVANDVTTKEVTLPKGQVLIESSDCQTCHHVKNTLVGPSYTAIANKYPNSAETTSYLTSKIKLGGSGVWGDTPMLAHPALSDEDAAEMVSYILSFKSTE